MSKTYTDHIATLRSQLEKAESSNIAKLEAELAEAQQTVNELETKLAAAYKEVGFEPAGTETGNGRRKGKGSTGGTRTRMTGEEKKTKILAALKEAGGQGLTAQEISTKTGIAGQTAYLFLKSSAIKSELETVKDGRTVIYSLKATAAAPISTGKGPNKTKK